MPRRVLSAEFRAGAPRIEALPSYAHAEIAVIGRSNVGKSTFVNRITDHSKLARISATPGKTQEINLFEVRLAPPTGKERRIVIADLPGFGFGRFSKERREHMSELTVRYVREREKLRLVCLLNDIRRAPERDEIAVRNLVLDAGRELMIVLTKADKLSSSQRKNAIVNYAEAFEIDSEMVIETGTKSPAMEFWDRIYPLIT